VTFVLVRRFYVTVSSRSGLGAFLSPLLQRTQGSTTAPEAAETGANGARSRAGRARDQGQSRQTDGDTAAPRAPTGATGGEGGQPGEDGPGPGRHELWCGRGWFTGSVRHYKPR
jgi:hypothetical protein